MGSAGCHAASAFAAVYMAPFLTRPVNARGITATCPRWVLPGEELPLHVRIPKGVTPTLKTVRIHLDSSLEVRDVINMPDYVQDGQTLLVRSFNRDSMSEYDYFGVAVATSAPFEDLKKEVPVLMEFNHADGTVDTVTENIRVFRPLLQVGDMPRSLALRDGNGQRLQLPVSLRYSGFGDVKVRIECTVQGSVVSSGSSMLDEVLRMVVRGGLVEEDEDPGNTVQISPEYVEQTVSELKEALDADESLKSMVDRLRLDKESAAVLLNLRSESKERFMTVIHKTVETYVAQIVSDILSRNISDNLRMETTSIRTKIKLPTTRVEIKLHYEDLAGNQYDPLCWDFEIIDQRTNPSAFDAEIPLVIKDVDDRKAFKNVGGMEIRA